ncbi:MAG: glutamine-hydrolyzing carbamoyl-phosphate synthase small subunit [Deltaproteobacteria bacterium]|nr:glutamine-hydrolyzing carbamoyl-phosphate synthase small subunit [Deltaproteobacteria bacterium]
MTLPALLALEDGTVFRARAFTGPGEALGEVVFNTAMTGYQEILTDPSYRGQLITMTYPLIGNYGVNAEDVESDRVQAEALLVKEHLPFPSNFRSREPLGDYLKRAGVLGLEGLDTRALTRHIRNFGAMRAAASTELLDPEALAARARSIPSMAGLSLVDRVTCTRPFRWRQGRVVPLSSEELKNPWPGAETANKVVVLDYGVKYNILRLLEERGCSVLATPASTSAREILDWQPDGVMLSNGPGDPAANPEIVQVVRNLIGLLPIFGICLGHQIIGLALGGTTFKLKFGHRGANHPVLHLKTEKVEITSQNHGFNVEFDSVKDPEVEFTHINLNDRTLEGLEHRRFPLFSVQYHPEASPGPHDASYLFDHFLELMEAHRRR